MMGQPCKVFTYTNVTTEKDALANIRRAAESGGWTIDKDAIDADGELYLHSLGNGHQRLYFSLKLESAYDNPERFLLSVHGNTGFDGSVAWDAQPGRFTEKIRGGFIENNSGKPVWHLRENKESATSTGWWLVPPVTEQVVLVCPSFVLTAIRVTFIFVDGVGTPYSGWVPLMFGAADGDGNETELNTVQWSAWSPNCAMGLMLSALYQLPNDARVNYGMICNNYGNIGFLYGGENRECLLPKRGQYGYGYATTEAAPSVIRTSMFVHKKVLGPYGMSACVSITVYGHTGTLNCYKGKTCQSVLSYTTAVLQNPFSLRHILIKPLIYVATKEAVRIVGELPYYAVNMHGLKGKDRIRIGGRVFMVFPDISDDDEIGLAVEVEA